MSGSALQFFLAFVIVLVLIGAAAWFARRFANSRLGSSANRGRMPRLAVIDAAAVDGRRRLVLVRRDNVEHLLMIGGPSDIVVEPNIVRATPPREQMLPRTADPGWTENDTPRAESLDHDRAPALPDMPPPRAPRPAIPEPRPSFTEELRRAPPPLPERRAPVTDPLAGFAPEPIGRHEPQPVREPSLREPRPIPREPMMPRPSRPLDAAPKAAPPVRPAPSPITERPTASSLSDEEKNLADMAKRLEDALRRSPPEEAVAPPVAPDTPAPRPAAPPRDESRPADAKAPFKSLEDEMASLLGRPKSPS